MLYYEDRADYFAFYRLSFLWGLHHYTRPRVSVPVAILTGALHRNCCGRVGNDGGVRMVLHVVARVPSVRYLLFREYPRWELFA